MGEGGESGYSFGGFEAVSEEAEWGGGWGGSEERGVKEIVGVQRRTRVIDVGFMPANNVSWVGHDDGCWLSEFWGKNLDDYDGLVSGSDVRW